MMGAFAEFERNIIRKRQAEGIAKAKERGVYENRKRKRKVSYKRILDLKYEGLNNNEIAKYLGVSRMTIYRSTLSKKENTESEHNYLSRNISINSDPVTSPSL